ncbi:MAG: hypothetical protein IJ181_06830, partial [Acidaminococcaceae bacterium]|nr:hypothetical protein [Acidaminococcaceae bacterium]
HVFTDNGTLVDYRLGRRYIFKLDKPVDSDELHRFISKRTRDIQALASFDAEILNSLYLKLPKEIASEFNVGVDFCIIDNQYF